MLGGIAASGLVGVEVLPSTSESSSGLEIDVVDFEGPDPANPDGPPITWRQTRVFTGSRTTFPKMPEITQ